MQRVLKSFIFLYIYLFGDKMHQRYPTRLKLGPQFCMVGVLNQPTWCDSTVVRDRKHRDCQDSNQG